MLVAVGSNTPVPVTVSFIAPLNTPENIPLVFADPIVIFVLEDRFAEPNRPPIVTVGEPPEVVIAELPETVTVEYVWFDANESAALVATVTPDIVTEPLGIFKLIKLLPPKSPFNLTVPEVLAVSLTFWS